MKFPFVIGKNRNSIYLEKHAYDLSIKMTTKDAAMHLGIEWD
jgi:hypothetical protein